MVGSTMADIDPLPSPRPWWANTKVEDFRTRVNDLPLDVLPALVNELHGAISSMQAQLETRGREDHFDWWTRARAALGFTVEKRSIVRAEILRRQSSIARESFRHVLDEIDGQLQVADTCLTGGAFVKAKLAVARARAVIEAAR